MYCDAELDANDVVMPGLLPSSVSKCKLPNENPVTGVVNVIETSAVQSIDSSVRADKVAAEVVSSANGTVSLPKRKNGHRTYQHAK